MSTLRIEDNKAVTPYTLQIDSGLTIISDDSGTGKTFLFKALDTYCKVNSIPHKLINHSNYDDVVIDDDMEIIMLDNLDLYMTHQVVKDAVSHAKYVICSCKSVLRFPTVTTYMATLQYKEGRLVVVVDAVYNRG